MKNRRRVTEEDLIITEALIATSYGRLKQSVIRAPARAFRSLGQAAREHPYATAGTAVAGGAILYGIIKKMTSHHHAGRTHECSQAVPPQKDRSPDLMHELLLMSIPLVAPYLMSYIQKYLEGLQPGERN